MVILAVLFEFLYGVRKPLDVFLGIARKREAMGNDRDILHWWTVMLVTLKY
jgi:hypothetical protein